MMLKTENASVLFYLKNKLHKWKTIAIIFIALSSLFLIKILFGNPFSKSVIGDYIANIKIEGIIFEDDYRSEVLEAIKKDDSAKAFIVTINSPGGGIVGSEILFEELRKIAQEKPLVVVMNSLAASGGYMAAIASNYIIARNGTLTGSIGVLMQSAEFTELADRFGVKFNTYKSSPLKGSPSPFEKSSPLVDGVVKASIEDSYKFFVDLVKSRRGERLNEKMLAEIFDGRVFTGRQALKAGLIDEIGGRDEALRYLNQNHKIDTESLPVKDISTIKVEETIIEKIFGIIPFFKKTSKNQGQEIMAIMPI